MLSISNKFDVGQEVYYIGRKCYQNGIGHEKMKVVKICGS